MTTYWRAMWFIRTRNYFLLAALLFFAAQLQGNGSDSCPLTVRYRRATLNYSAGDSLTLNCTIQYCGTEKPTVHWCKLLSNSCCPLTGENMTHLTSLNGTEQTMLVVYTVSSVNLTDSGTYQCQAQQGVTGAMGNSITVNVFVTATGSTMKESNLITTPVWVFYSIIVVGIVGAALFLVMITYFCIRNFNEPLEPLERNDNSRRNECNAMTEINGKSTIYENANTCSDGIGSAIPNPFPANSSNSPGSDNDDACPSDTSPHDSIIYASLNQSILRRKPSVILPNEEDTEYAAINIKI
ncbi:uncharacterized protein zgc:174945 isoform X2 [Heptranchias perlo]|uniref:uncharacterized protein zgc:174945 isoform X2 n=1 Tax=Heptranchias perlo TaxID=212740 RepID=UPI003559CC85